MLRVAALQFAVLPDVDHNLATVRQLMQRAVSEHGAQLIVLPEFTNHPAVLGDPDSARLAATTLDGTFLTAVRDTCRELQVHVVIGVSLIEAEQVTSSALLYAPDGALLGRADRQILTSALADCHSVGSASALTVATEIGHLGLCVGRDLASMETIRSLSLSGAQLVCVPFGADSAADVTTHLSARAAENRVFVIGAGSLLAQPELANVGRSQVIGPDGAQLALATDDSPCVVPCEVSLQDAQDKQRTDGTDIFSLRRPDLYRPLLGKVLRDRTSETSEAGADSATAAARRPVFDRTLQVAVLSSVDAGSIEGLIDSAAGFVRELAQQKVALVVLPELFCFQEGHVVDPEAAADWFQPAARRLAEACAGAATHVVTSLVERTAQGFAHVGVIIGHAGVVARAGQLHVPARHSWATPARRFELLPLPWGKVALLVGEDAIVPEAARALSLLGAELLIATLGRDAAARSLLTAAAVENDVPVVAATRSGAAGGSFIIDPASGQTALVASPEQSILRGSVRRVTHRVGLLERPYRLAQGLVTAQVSAVSST